MTIVWCCSRTNSTCSEPDCRPQSTASPDRHCVPGGHIAIGPVASLQRGRFIISKLCSFPYVTTSVVKNASAESRPFAVLAIERPNSR